MIWQPFASASVFHEFAGNVTSTAASLPNGAFATVGVCPLCVVTPITLTGANSTTRVGTYGQYSLGLAAQVANTGWLGFVRVDYRNGHNIEGWTGNGGLRYQFTPETIAAVMPTKAPVRASTVIPPTYWTGFYIGGFLGVGFGKTDIRFVGDPGGAGNNPRVSVGWAAVRSATTIRSTDGSWVWKATSALPISTEPGPAELPMAWTPRDSWSGSIRPT
jgi:hypothetical protein